MLRTPRTRGHVYEQGEGENAGGKKSGGVPGRGKEERVVGLYGKLSWNVCPYLKGGK